MKKEVECYLGQVRALAAWFPEIGISTPFINSYLRKGVHFQWTAKLQKEFDAVKISLSRPSVLSPFDLDKKTVLYCDASRLNGHGVYSLTGRS